MLDVFCKLMDLHWSGSSANNRATPFYMYITSLNINFILRTKKREWTTLLLAEGEVLESQHVALQVREDWLPIGPTGFK